MTKIFKKKPFAISFTSPNHCYSKDRNLKTGSHRRDSFQKTKIRFTTAGSELSLLCTSKKKEKTVQHYSNVKHTPQIFQQPTLNQQKKLNYVDLSITLAGWVGEVVVFCKPREPSRLTLDCLSRASVQENNCCDCGKIESLNVVRRAAASPAVSLRFSGETRKVAKTIFFCLAEYCNPSSLPRINIKQTCTDVDFYPK